MGREPRSKADRAAELTHFKRLGERLTELRKIKGLTPQDLADKLGVTRQYIYMIEKGRAKPSEERIREIGKALGELGDEFMATAMEFVEREFETKLREAGLSQEEIAQAAKRVSARAKQSVVSGDEPLRVARGKPATEDVLGALDSGEEVVAMEAFGEEGSAYDYAKSVRGEFERSERAGAPMVSASSRSAGPGASIQAGPYARILVDRPLTDDEQRALRDMAKVIAHLLQR